MGALGVRLCVLAAVFAHGGQLLHALDLQSRDPPGLRILAPSNGSRVAGSEFQVDMSLVVPVGAAAPPEWIYCLRIQGAGVQLWGQTLHSHSDDCQRTPITSKRFTHMRPGRYQVRA